MKTALSIFVCLLCARAATAGPITATLEGCVSVSDPRLASAFWSASGTFTAVAFDEETPGCAATIAHAVRDAYEFEDNRAQDSLAAWLDMSNLPVCGRRQYDLQPYLAAGGLDEWGLKSLVIDTGIACAGAASALAGDSVGIGTAQPGGSGSSGTTPTETSPRGTPPPTLPIVIPPTTPPSDPEDPGGPQSVPEPSSIALLCVGALTSVIARRRRTRSSRESSGA